MRNLLIPLPPFQRERERERERKKRRKTRRNVSLPFCPFLPTLPSLNPISLRGPFKQTLLKINTVSRPRAFIISRTNLEKDPEKAKKRGREEEGGGGGKKTTQQLLFLPSIHPSIHPLDFAFEKKKKKEKGKNHPP